MTPYTRLYILLLITFFTVPAHAQKQGQQLVDSLLGQLRSDRYKDAEDTGKARLLYNLSKAYYAYDISIDSSLKRGNEAMALSEQNKWEYGVALANIMLGSDYLAQSDPSKAMYCFLVSEKIFEAQGRKKDMAYAYINIGNVYSFQNNIPKELEYFFKALRISEQLNNKEVVVIILNKISGIYSYSASYKSALEYSLKSLRISEEVKDTGNIKYALLDIGVAYYGLKKNDSAIFYYKTALDIALGGNDSNFEARSINNLADVYQAQEKYDLALENYFASLYIFERMGQQPEITNAYAGIVEVYIKQKKYVDAETYANKELADAKAIASLQQMVYANENLYKIYAATGRFKESLTCYKAYVADKDSLINTANAKKLVQSQMQYDFDRKEDSTEAEQDKKDLVVKAELTRQKNEKLFILCGGFLMLLIAGGALYFLFYTRRAKKQIEIQKNRAEQSERFKQQFLANMSHEIRTPMNAVSGMTDLLIEKGPRPDQEEYLQAISKSSDILLHIINDILDLSKIEAGKLELETIDFSLADTIKQVKDTLSYKAEEKGLQLIWNIAADVADVVIGDPYRLNQVLINLGGNAIKFTQKGSVEIAVKKISETTGSEALRISVTDTGMGIPQDKLRTLFESFTQVNTSDTRKFGGTGLGLSISKQLVELQGGSISVESKEGSGTTFSFIIDYKKGSAEKLQQRTEDEQHVDGSILDGLRILVADDNEYNRLVVNETLRLKANVQIDLAVNGQEAVQQLKKNDYDVILMDVQMPVMNGIEATQYIRSKMAAPKSTTPIIALTASILRADLDMCAGSGMNSYVPKPFKAWQLIYTIADVTGRKHAAGKTIKTERPKPVVRNNAAASDLAYLREFCEGDEERMKKYISLYVKAVPAFKEKLGAAVATKDLEEIALQVHSFKPKWMMMGMEAARDLSVTIDLQCRENDDRVYENVTLLVEQTDRSVKELTAVL